MSTTLHLGISPCPNDTYIFGALVQGQVDLAGYRLRTHLADVQELNEAALAGRFDVLKISAAVYDRIQADYCMLNCGGALGWGCGPLLVASKPVTVADLATAPIAVPGRLTTATKLVERHGGFHGQLQVMRYDRIMPAVAAGEVSAGVVIHEGRFTYPEYGLHLVLDLGAWWERTIRMPLPLGVIVARRSLGPDFARWIQGRIQASLRQAQKDPGAIWPFIRDNAQEMDRATIDRHIQTFVNGSSWDMGQEGQRAVAALLGI